MCWGFLRESVDTADVMHSPQVTETVLHITRDMNRHPSYEPSHLMQGAGNVKSFVSVREKE